MMRKSTFLTRAAMTLLLVLFFPLWGSVGQLWADQVTASQARQQAQAFLNSRIASGNGPRHAPGVTPQLMQEKQVSGLYVFNINNNGGFIIVSNDDCALPILGYSDSGTLDPDHMPDNMRAWLQGYADQIAWLQAHGTPSGQNTRHRAPRRIGNHATTAIRPLLGEDNDANAIKWDQDEPYNNLCPNYRGSNRAVTGCVATAMAQVMKYHEWPTEATTAIPGYTTDSYGIDLTAGLPATTFDWANMKPSYSGSYTTAEATAVATLMQYCGYSIEMDYGPSSGSNTDMVAKALKAYFDYNKTTTQFVSRSFYTPAKWADLIYHELANRRPVVYGGMSSGGGHEFVCDGYKYEGGDLFHINWGWGGASDGYFVLSALDPDVQGIGGSSSSDGFNYGQDAVIGIQPSTGNGEMSDIQPNVVNLTVNSMTPSSNPTVKGFQINIKLNITNNSDDDYDGDIYIGRKYSGPSYELLEGGNFLIPAGETKDIVIPFVPTKLGSYDLVLFLPNTSGSYSTNGVVYATVNVIEAVQNQIVPVYSYYCDELSRSQFIIPAAKLMEMVNTTLNGITFYATTSSALSWPGAEFDVYLKEVTETTFADATLKEWISLEKVYSGSLSVGSNGRMEITFDTPYYYKGGNLLIGVNQTKVYDDDYFRCYWLGTEVTGASLGGYSTTISQQNFLPMTTFDYTATAKPTNIAVAPSSTSATVTWTGNENATGYNLRYRAVPESISYDFESAEPWVVDDFAPFTTYDGDGLSTYGVSDIEFTNQRYTGALIAFQNGTAGGFTAHSGNAFGCFMDNSSQNDDWFISPEVEIAEGTVFSFWARSITDSYGLERFKVGIYGSADGTFTEYLAGSATTYEEAPTTWTKYEYNLSDYAGQTIKLAINCVSKDAFAFCIDDIFIGNPDGNSWETIEGVTSPYNLNGLVGETTYELQLQAVYAEGASGWTNTNTFTTYRSVVLADAATNNSEVIDKNNDETVSVILSGRTLYKDDAWNTLCLPFDIDLTADGCPLAGAIAKTLTDATMTGTHVTLTFGEEVTTLQANVPYIIKWTASAENIVDPEFSNVTIEHANEAGRTILKADGQVKFIGYYDAFTINTPANDDIYYMTDDNTLKHTGKERTLKACRAYFQFSNDIVNSGRRFVLDFGEGNVVTGLENIQRVLESQSNWYTIDGRRLEGAPTKKGLYINKNKKRIVK